MSNRKLLVLSAVFLGLFAFVVLYERRQPTSEDAARAKKHFLELRTEDVTSVRIERPDLPPVELKRRPSGGWELPGNGRADAVTVDGLLADLNRLDLVGDVRTDVDPKEQGLDTPKAKVILTLKDGSSRKISFGKEVPGTDAAAAADGERFAAVKFAPLATLSKPVDEFRSKTLFDVPVAELTRLTVARGPNRVVLAREERPENAVGAWRLEAPVADLASEGFVDRLLSDLAAARVSEYPSVSETELARVGLQPPSAVVTLQKGAQVVATISFGAAKAEATGKMYVRTDGQVAVIDDRVQEDLAKELSAYREARICPVETYLARRVSFVSEDLSAGADKVEGEWRAGGRTVSPALPENLIGRLGKAESKDFVARKDFVSHGIPTAKDAHPLATVELLVEKDATPRIVRLFAAASSGGGPLVAAEVSGRPDALLVERTLLDDLRADAARLREASKGAPSPAVSPTSASSSPSSSKSKSR